mmetsp:Transcript_27687/g.51959  ORF Transcript_27687/g.51959 Transcript_27687/m.51959 type:complete len:575 (+) Transcript_27687:700-2424(+)
MTCSPTRSSSNPFWKTFLLWLLLVMNSGWFSTTINTMMVDAAPVQLHGLNYNTRQGPDWDWDKCKSYETILQELTLLQRLTTRFRILSLTDCGQGDLVLTVAQALGLQVWLGLWVGPDHVDKFGEELAALEVLLDKFDAGANNDLILGITVGSEAIYREDATVEEMIDYMNQVHDILQDRGLDETLPVSIVDVAPEYAANQNLRQAVNVTYTNTFPFWEGVSVDAAVDELETDLGWLVYLDPSKPFVLGETGWPSDGFIEGVGIAGPQEQAQYFQQAYCYLHRREWDYYWFTGIDNAWRQEQDPMNTVEGTFGILYANLTLKPHFQGMFFTCDHNGVTYSMDEIDWTIPERSTPPPTELDPASCQAYDLCRQADLWGNCCPTPEGLTLGCCEGGGSGTTTDFNTTTAPTSATTAQQTTDAPTVASTDAISNSTDSPTAAATVEESTEAPTVTTTTASTDSPTAAGTSTTTSSPTMLEDEISTTVPTSSETNTEFPTAEPQDTDAPVTLSPTEEQTLMPVALPTMGSMAPATPGSLPASFGGQDEASSSAACLKRTVWMTMQGMLAVVGCLVLSW